MLIKDFIPLNVDEFKDVVRNRTISCFEKATRLSTYSLVFNSRNDAIQYFKEECEWARQEFEDNIDTNYILKANEVAPNRHYYLAQRSNDNVYIHIILLDYCYYQRGE